VALREVDEKIDARAEQHEQVAEVLGEVKVGGLLLDAGLGRLGTLPVRQTHLEQHGLDAVDHRGADVAQQEHDHHHDEHLGRGVLLELLARHGHPAGRAVMCWWTSRKASPGPPGALNLAHDGAAEVEH